VSRRERKQNDLNSAYKKWHDGTYTSAVERNSERYAEFSTSSIPIKELYTELDINESDYTSDIGYPGEYPFTRGIQANMYRGRLWTMRQYAGFGTPSESNERFQYLLKNGQTGLSVAFDLPSQLGYDSIDPRSQGEVGKVGVAIDSLKDMETMFQGIPLDTVSTSMTINAPASVMLLMYQAVGEQQGISPEKLTGTVQNDVLKEYVARGTYIFPPRESTRIAADLIAYCSSVMPRWNPISISGYHIRDAGSTAVQEIAFTLSNAITYVEAVLERGVPIDDFAPRISWIFNTHNNFFEEIAKYRALRRMWARLVRERWSAKDPRSMSLRTHTQTGGSTLTAQQPENNIIRTALQALAASLGGVQSMALSCYDEALSIPTEEAQRIALRTQQVLAYESGIAETVDPLAGSYYIEYLTNELENRAMEYMRTIEDMGGSVTAIENGYMQRHIADAAYFAQKSVESEEQIVVGVNRFTDENEQKAAIFRPNPQAFETQRVSLLELKQWRDSVAVGERLDALRRTALGNDNIMPFMLEAIKSYATLGEICGTLREVWGEYVTSVEV
jgi:methylmalonyl-CoA mutase N-terminal domain/subunit